LSRFLPTVGQRKSAHACAWKRESPQGQCCRWCASEHALHPGQQHMQPQEQPNPSSPYVHDKRRFFCLLSTRRYLELVEYRGFAGGIQPHHQDAHLFLGKEASEHLNDIRLQVLSTWKAACAHLYMRLTRGHEPSACQNQAGLQKISAKQHDTPIFELRKGHW
jgi:hypothetical protein